MAIQQSVNTLINTALGAVGVSALKKGNKISSEAVKLAELEDRAGIGSGITEDIKNKQAEYGSQAQAKIAKAKELGATQKQLETVEDAAWKEAMQRVNAYKSSISQSIQAKYASGEITTKQFKEEFLKEKLEEFNFAKRQNTPEFDSIEDEKASKYAEEERKSASEKMLDLLEEK